MLIRLQHLAFTIFAIGALFWAAGDVLQDIGHSAPALGAHLVGLIALCIAVPLGLVTAVIHDERRMRDRFIRALFARKAAVIRVRARR